MLSNISSSSGASARSGACTGVCLGHDVEKSILAGLWGGGVNMSSLWWIAPKALLCEAARLDNATAAYLPRVLCQNNEELHGVLLKHTSQQVLQEPTSVIAS